MSDSEQSKITPRDVEKGLLTDANLLNAMRKLSKNKELAKATLTEWERNFIGDVAAKAADYRDRLTDKQRETVKKIFKKQAVLEALAHIYNQEIDEANRRVSDEWNTLVREPAKSYDYSNDPLWGIY